MEFASDTGKGRKMTELTMAKRAVLAAMHTEKVRSTVRAKPLSRHKERTPYFRSRRNASMVCDPSIAETVICQPLRQAGPLGFSTHKRRAKFKYHCTLSKGANTKIPWKSSARRMRCGSMRIATQTTGARLFLLRCVPAVQSSQGPPLRPKFTGTQWQGDRGRSPAERAQLARSRRFSKCSQALQKC